MQVGMLCPFKGPVSHQACRECAVDPLHPCDYTPDQLEMMRIDYEDEDREPGVESFTPTRILGCMRQPVFLREGNYYVDPDRCWPLVRGNMVHALFERSRASAEVTSYLAATDPDLAHRTISVMNMGARYPGAVATIRERRMRVQVETRYGPQTFTGKADLIVVNRVDPEDRTLHVKVVDYKSTNEIGHEDVAVKDEHEWQVNMYAWLVSLTLPEALGFAAYRVVIDELEVVYISMKKVRRFTSAGPRVTKGKMTRRTPPEYAPLALAPIMKHPLVAVGLFVRQRIERRIAADTTLPDILEGDAAWRCRFCPVYDACHAVGNQPVAPSLTEEASE